MEEDSQFQALILANSYGAFQNGLQKKRTHIACGMLMTVILLNPAVGAALTNVYIAGKICWAAQTRFALKFPNNCVKCGLKRPEVSEEV